MSSERQYVFAPRAIVGDGKAVVAPAWIAVQGGTIVGLSSRSPSDASAHNTTELPDATITPGLLNLHDHISRKSLREDTSPVPFSHLVTVLMSQDTHYLVLLSASNARHALLQEGITFFRDYGLAGYTSEHLRRAIRDGLVEGPELSTCGRPICITGGHCHEHSHEADGAEGVRSAVRWELRAGATIIKFMASGGLEKFPDEDPHRSELSEAEMHAGVEEAHRQGILTVAHAYPKDSVMNAINAGVDTIEHGVFLDGECIAAMLQRGTTLVSTQTGLRGAIVRGPDNESNMQERRELWERVFTPNEESVRHAIEAGVQVGLGTDSAGKLADEIRLVARTCSEDPVKAISHATGIGASVAKRTDIGLLVQGRRATMVAFAGDLTASLDGLDDVVQVWRDGRALLPDAR